MSQDVTRKHFDGRAHDYYARNYRAPQSRHERALALRRDLCTGMLADVHGRILDLGCGPGAMAISLISPRRTVVAFDLSPQMVLAARELIGDLASYCVGDAAALPFADHSFDAVVTTGVLEYVPEISRALGEIARVLRPGGTFVGTVSLPRKLERAVTAAYIKLRGRGELPYHRAFEWQEFDALVTDAGLRIDERRFSYFAPFPLDVGFPSLVSLLDRGARWLEQSERARRTAKTYVIRAVL